MRGIIADIDGSVPGEPHHPATVLIVEVGEQMSRVLVPDAVIAGRRALLCAGRPVRIVGEINRSRSGSHSVASDLQLIVGGH